MVFACVHPCPPVCFLSPPAMVMVMLMDVLVCWYSNGILMVFSCVHPCPPVCFLSPPAMVMVMMMDVLVCWYSNGVRLCPPVSACVFPVAACDGDGDDDGCFSLLVF